MFSAKYENKLEKKKKTRHKKPVKKVLTYQVKYEERNNSKKS